MIAENFGEKEYTDEELAVVVIIVAFDIYGHLKGLLKERN